MIIDLITKYFQDDELWLSLSEGERQNLRNVVDSKQNNVIQHISEELQQLTSNTFLEFDGVNWCFISRSFELYIQALWVIQHESIESLNTEQVVAHFRRKIDRQDEEGGVEGDLLLQFIVIHLVNQYGRTTLPYKLLEGVHADEFWRYYHFITSVLPVLKLPSSEFINVYALLEDRGRGDFAFSLIWVEHFGQSQPDNALQIIEDVLVTPPLQSNVLERLLIGVSRNSPDCLDKVQSLCLRLVKEEDPALNSLALVVLLNLLLQQRLEVEHLVAIVEEVEVEKDVILLGRVAFTISHIGNLSTQREDYCVQRLQDLKSAHPSFVADLNYAIALALSQMRRSGRADYTIRCLLLTIDTPSENVGTIQLIEGVLYELTSQHAEGVWDFFELWATHHDDKATMFSRNGFLHALQELMEHHQKVSLFRLTLWLVSENTRIINEAHSVILEFNIRFLDAERIQIMSRQEIKYMIEKLMGSFFSGDQTLAILYSIIQATGQKGELRPYLSRVIEEVVINFPGSSDNFFREHTSNGQVFPDDQNMSRIFQPAFEKLNAYTAHYQREWPAELLPSIQRTRKYRGFELKRQRIAEQAAKEDGRFVFQKLFPTVMIARGNRTFHIDIRGTRTFSTPTEFASIEHSIELPRREVLDPEGEIFKRLVRRNITFDDRILANEED